MSAPPEAGDKQRQRPGEGALGLKKDMRALRSLARRRPPRFSHVAAYRLACLAGARDRETTIKLRCWLNHEAQVLDFAPEKRARRQGVRQVLSAIESDNKRVRAALAAKRELRREILQNIETLATEVGDFIVSAYVDEIPDSDEHRDTLGRRRAVSDLAAARRLFGKLEEAEDRIDRAERTGRKDLRVQHLAAEALARKYEEISGHDYRWHRAKVGGKHSWGHSNKAVRFVEQALRTWFPKITDAELVTVMRGKNRKSKDLHNR